MPNLVHRRLRAPQADGAALIDPPLAQVPQLLEANQRQLAQLEERAGFPSGFRTAARKSLLALTKVGPQSSNLPLILSGHQPDLFHPGVWFKNFLLSEVANRSGGMGINLIIDNDTIRASELRVPTKNGSTSSVISVPFDATTEELPWEERAILDSHRFRDFPDRVRQAFKTIQSSNAAASPLLLDQLWPFAVQAQDQEVEARAANLGICLADARHSLERQLGLSTSECQLSAVVGGAAFLIFASYLFERHREFAAIHNAALRDYRLVNHIRSHSHPVPDLVTDGETYEVPFWIWTKQDPQRRRAFVRTSGNSWELTDQAGITIHAQANEWPEMRHFAQQLQLQGIKLRPRALITTMYARLVLSDLFIHGIGGAKYDDVTDLIIRRLFGIEPPAYVTATATFRLPIERPQVSLNDVRSSSRRIREMRYRPEAYVRDPLVTRDADLATKLAALAAEKREHLAQHDLRRCSPDVFQQLDQLNCAMYEKLKPLERELRARHDELLVALKQSQLLGSREFSFVLFPSEILPARLLDLCKVMS